MRFLRRRAATVPDLLAPEEIAFLLCVEANELEPQARMLCESIRTFGGRYRRAPIIAVSPRPHLALSSAGQAKLEALGVTYASLPLNLTGSTYGTINRIVAGNWARANLAQPYLVLLDTDMLMVAEPQFVRADVGVRPVDGKGSATSGPDDPLDEYWGRLCEFAGISLDDLPMVQATIDGSRLRAAYNGGFVVVRRDLSVLERTHDIFFASFERGLRPRGFPGEVKASTGMVGLEATGWWGSSQAALSTAIWSSTSNVHEYGPAYNIPAHALADAAQAWPAVEPVLVHYHYLAQPEYQSHLQDVLQRLGCSETVQEWVNARLQWFDRADVCLCTLAIHAPYRERALQLCADAPLMPWVVLTDEPDDFAGSTVRAIAHSPTGPMAVDYLERLAPTGNSRGAAAYHDKRFALMHALQHHDTAVFLDADSRLADLPVLAPFPPGLSVLPVVRRTIAEHLQVAGSWRLPAFDALAIELTGSSDVLHHAVWCHEACIAVTKNGDEATFFDTWGRAAAFMQDREVYSGEGGVIGLAAHMAGWSVDFDAMVTLGQALHHEGGGPKAAPDAH